MEPDLQRDPQYPSQVRGILDNSAPSNDTHVQLRLLNHVLRQRTTVSKREKMFFLEGKNKVKINGRFFR
jgi:hypothetical protein